MLPWLLRLKRRHTSGTASTALFWVRSDRSDLCRSVQNEVGQVGRQLLRQPQQLRQLLEVSRASIGTGLGFTQEPLQNGPSITIEVFAAHLQGSLGCRDMLELCIFSCWVLGRPREVGAPVMLTPRSISPTAKASVPKTDFFNCFFHVLPHSIPFLHIWKIRH